MSKINLKEGTAPTTPASGEVSVYVKTDKQLYIKDDTGTESGVTSDNKVRISATDTTNDYLNGKIPSTATITTAILNPGADEQIELSVDESGLTLDNLGGTLSVSKGGTGQTTLLLAFDNLSPLTTKGDLLTTDASNNIRFPVGTNGQVLSANSAQASGLEWITGAGAVTSVALSAPGLLFSVTGSPVTTTGTLTLDLITQTANRILAGPTTGIPANPTFRSLVAADLPLISLTTGVSGTLPIANGGTNATTADAAFDNLSPLTTKGDVLVYSTLNTRLPVGTNGQVLSANSAQASGLEWITASGAGFDPTTTITLYDDFIGNDQSAAAASIRSVGTLGWRVVNPGGASTVEFISAGVDTNHPGVLEVTSGSSAGNYCDMSINIGQSIKLGGGQLAFDYLIQIPTLSTVTNEYIQRWGLGDVQAADHDNGVYFEYARATSGDFFRIRTANSSTRTTTVTGTAVAAATWYKLRAVVNAAGTSIQYFINGSSVGTITTNIPTGAISPSMSSQRSAGAARSFRIDYFYLVQTFTSSR